MTKRLNILFMTENFRDNVCIHHLWELEQAIGKHANCRWAGLGHPLYKANENVNDTIRRVMRRANWVIYYDFGTTKRGMTINVPKKIHGRKYNVAAYIGDIQRYPDKYLKHLNNCGWDALLMAYIKTGRQVNWAQKKRGRGLTMRELRNISRFHYTRGLNVPWFYTAPSINPEKFKPLDTPRKYDVAMIGALHDVAYPIRNHLWKHLPSYAEENGWNTLIRKGPVGRSLDRSIKELKEEHIVGERYSKALAESKIFIFGTSVFKYVLFKFPEAMACKTLVMADTPITADEYHLVPDWNFVAINEVNWKEKLKYYLENDDEREKIAQRGYETVMKYHTTDIRAQEVIEFLKGVK